MTAYLEARRSSAALVMALLERGRLLCTPPLRDAVGRLAAPMDTVAAYHFGWIDRDGRPDSAASGKGVRPALALLSAEAAGATAEAGVPAAVAVELVHNFSLLHDDLMDGDETRRHRATAWTVFSPGHALLAGDALLALATEVLFEAPESTGAQPADAIRAVRRMATATHRLIDGQARDLSFERRDRVSVEECLRMEGHKTGALIACSSSIGAVLAGADDRTADALERFGYHLGLAFQAVDDILGIWGSPEVTGKPRWSDLRRRKKSLPISAALAGGDAAAARFAAAFADLPDADATEQSGNELRYAIAAGLAEEAGGRAWTEAEAERQREHAMAALDGVPMPYEVWANFAALAEFVVTREK